MSTDRVSTDLRTGEALLGVIAVIVAFDPISVTVYDESDCPLTVRVSVEVAVPETNGPVMQVIWV